MLKAMMTAEQLQIEEWEKEALIWLRDQILEGEIEYYNFEMDEAPAQGNTLNMVISYSKFDCGTVCCVGGWMALYHGELQISEYVASHQRLNELFYPDEELGDMNEITEREVLETIDHFLYTGEIVWNLKA